LNFLTPISFWALLALLVPLVFHLWNKKKRNVVKIGSIAWLTEAKKNKPALNFSISEWPLLLMRFLMIVALVFLLAQPFLTKDKTVDEGNKYCLILQDILPIDGDYHAIFSGKIFNDTIQFSSIEKLEKTLKDLSYKKVKYDSIYLLMMATNNLLPNQKISIGKNANVTILPPRTDASICYARNGSEYSYTSTDTISLYNDHQCSNTIAVNDTAFISQKTDSTNTKILTILLSIFNQTSNLKIDTFDQAQKSFSVLRTEKQSYFSAQNDRSSLSFYSQTKSKPINETALLKKPYQLTEWIFAQDTLNKLFQKKDHRAIEKASIFNFNDNQNKPQIQKTEKTKAFYQHYLLFLTLFFILLERFWTQKNQAI